MSIGGYLTPSGSTHLFPVVRKVESALAGDPTHSHAYLPSLGYEDVNRAAARLLFGEGSAAVREGRVFCLQSVGGTGTIRVGAEFLRDNLGMERAVYSDPTWMNHRDIFKKAGG